MYRSDETIQAHALPDRFTGPRIFSTAIYFLLKDGEFSAFHRIKSDEIWHFYTGAPLTLHTIDGDGKYGQIKLGGDFENGEAFQALIRAGWWYGATLNEPRSYALVGGTVAPGFDFDDFEMADRKTLIEQYPEHRSIIEQLTRS